MFSKILDSNNNFCLSRLVMDPSSLDLSSLAHLSPQTRKLHEMSQFHRTKTCLLVRCNNSTFTVAKVVLLGEDQKHNLHIATI